MSKNSSEKDSEKVEQETLNLLELDDSNAEKFFLKRENYCNFELPPYFCFEEVLKKVSKVLNGYRGFLAQRRLIRHTQNLFVIF